MIALALAALLTGGLAPDAAHSGPLALPPEARADLDAGRPARLLVELAAPADPHGRPAARAALQAARAQVRADRPAAARDAVRGYVGRPFRAGRFAAAAAAVLRAHPEVVA
ncbi:MAG: hypothetical protein R3263_07605, partial [Myxococcota bacterium]|nr:hypothetical protein [Myxococcota bacterium]